MLVIFILKTLPRCNSRRNMGRSLYEWKCVNIEFRNCYILANPTSSSYDCYSSTYGSTCDSIRLIGNRISGGYYGFYFEGQSSVGGYTTNIFIDSNIFEKAGYYSYYFYYTDLNSFSYNKSILEKWCNNHYTRFIIPIIIIRWGMGRIIPNKY